jgi:5-methylthioadenosine/S-adenosylhomocysteine deaminase
MPYDLVIHNGTIVTVNEAFEIIPDGLLCAKAGKLERIETLAGNQSLPAADETIDARGGLVMPGLVNTHTHLPMTLFRGLADDLPLDIWLNEHIFPAESAGGHYWPVLKCYFPERPRAVMGIFMKTWWPRPYKPAACAPYWPRV